MTTTGEIAAMWRVVRTAETYECKQGPSYAGGVSAESVGAQAI